MGGEDFAEQLLAIARELQGLTELPRKVAEIAAPKIAAVIDDEFAQGVGPRGEAWPALKSGAPSHLTQTGRMRDKVKVEADGTLVRGKLAAPANIHQYGSRNPKRGIPARPMFQRRELSPSWDEAMKSSAQEALDALAPLSKAAK